ncbi:MAG: hypothetical protein E6868_08180 [Pantoea sp.]|uniref:hypothetical protein n=1 Tax=Pantoea sp. TaxID=69393 RepID=UPI0029027E1C|nr:hypothetical protein [Pantoea sp.]MDU1573213.1 hypothetical protein [Pantoea sp.]
MTLLNWLLGVLPSRGGWRDGADFVAVSFGEAKFYQKTHGWMSTIDGVVDVREGEKVTREQYEVAFAASHRPLWNGEGMPPVGCVCEREVPRGWAKCKINYVSSTLIVYQMLESGNEHSSLISAFKFRPILTEAERKRNEAIKAITDSIIDFDLAIVEHRGEESSIAIEIYSRIAAGKIPHITLK